MEKECNLLEVRNLSVEYNTDEFTVYALDNLSLTVKKGRTLGLVGETGAGKTTLAKSVMRVLPVPPANIVGGEILLDGVDLLKLTEKQMRKVRGSKVTMIFQDPMTSLNPILSVGNQIAEVIMLHQNKNKKEAFAAAAKMLEVVGIEGSRAKEYPHQFSGGMKQRVVIALALACNPQLIIADEPTTALDVTIQAQVLELMMKLKESYGTAMIMITHDLGIIAEICDEVNIIYFGNIVERGLKKQIFLNPLHPYTQGLFKCIPDLYSDENMLIPIKGLMPEPTAKLKGCPFFSRCEKAFSRCENETPEEKEIEKGHTVKCFLY